MGVVGDSEEELACADLVRVQHIRSSYGVVDDRWVSADDLREAASAAHIHDRRHSL